MDLFGLRRITIKIYYYGDVPRSFNEILVQKKLQAIVDDCCKRCSSCKDEIVADLQQWKGEDRSPDLEEQLGKHYVDILNPAWTPSWRNLWSSYWSWDTKLDSYIGAVEFDTGLKSLGYAPKKDGTASVNPEKFDDDADRLKLTVDEKYQAYANVFFHEVLWHAMMDKWDTGGKGDIRDSNPSASYPTTGLKQFCSELMKELEQY